MHDHQSVKTLNIVWHETPEALQRVYWAEVLREAGVDPSEVADMTVFGQTAAGEEVPMTMDELVEATRAQGMWGFVDTNTRIIHAWADPSTPSEKVIHLLAHEIGHITGTPAGDDIEEEARADAFGLVAVEAFRMLAGRPGVSLDGRVVGGYQNCEIKTAVHVPCFLKLENEHLSTLDTR